MLIRVCYNFMGCVEVRVPLIMSVKLNYPGIVNRTFGNRTQSNSIELNPWIEFDWFRQSDEIEHRTLCEFDFLSNRIIEQIEPNRTQSIGLCSTEFGYWTQSNTVQWIALDCGRWINSLGQWSCYVVWLPAWLLCAGSGEPTYKASPSKTRFSFFS